jgi:hypothetical protein
MNDLHADDARAPFQVDPELIRWAHHARLNNPTMTSYGFACSKVLNKLKTGESSRFPRMLNNWAIQFTERDAWMVAASRQFLEAAGWNSSANSNNPGSYRLKHIAEEWAKSYIYEGALLLAAFELGVPLKRYGHDRWGAFVGVSVRGLRSLTAEP